jgi:hypothetical protein
MLANRRILKLKTLAIYEINSISTKTGAIPIGVPLGRNKFWISQRCCVTPIKFIPIKCVDAKKNVITKELVAVKEYGIKPVRFAKNMNVNKKNSIEKYCERFKLMLLFKIPLTSP